MATATSDRPQRPTMDEYGDHDIFGPRIESNNSLDKFKASNDSECVLFNIGTFAAKETFRLRDLIGTHKRLRQMVQGLAIDHPLPIQRYSWPKIYRSPFANVFVAPESSGKTYALLLYLVSKCIAAAPIDEAEELLNSETSNQYVPAAHSDLEKFIIHPKYIVISSSQDKVEALNRKIDLMKQHAYGNIVTDDQRRLLTPIARTINNHHDNEKLALRCNESEIIIGSPPALLRCLREGYLSFAKCKNVFFDDLDIALQLQNEPIREIIKAFLVQTQSLPKPVETKQASESEAKPQLALGSGCQMHIFSRKWTDLVRHFVGIFPQRTLMFASLAEAAVYTNTRFDVEYCNSDQEQRTRISSIVGVLVSGSPAAKIAVVCRTDEEAESACGWLNQQGHKVKLLKERDNDELIARTSTHQRTPRNLIIVISDAALEFEVEYSTRRRPLNDMTHLIHAALPDDMLTFDRRFRLLYKNIQDNKPEMTSTLMLGHRVKACIARQIYDLISRSGPTPMSAKLSMRDFIASQSSPICWRWATIGLCRLEKLSREDRFGSYCFDRHTLLAKHRTSLNGLTTNYNTGPASNRWPKEGLVRLTLTHIVSPSEFYFWFEGARSIGDGSWIKFENSGRSYMRALQTRLDRLKDAPPRSVPLADVKRGERFGVYFPQECRVDRVVVLDELAIESKGPAMINKDLEYSRQIRVFKIDYGSRLEVYVRNLIELDEDLRKAPAQSHRGLHLGYKPTHNEPNWPYKSKRQFYELACSSQEQTISAWLRLNSDECFWFESMLVSRKLSNIDSNDIDTFSPHKRLLKQNLADATSAEPHGLPASNRNRTLCKWDHLLLSKASQFAFIDRSAPSSEVFLLDATDNLDVLLRLVKFNKELIRLEEELMFEYQSSKLERQELVEPGVICLARIDSPGSCINRVRVVSAHLDQGGDIESPESAPVRRVTVECLDHGDLQVVTADNLLRAKLVHVSKLPFQAMKRKIANLNMCELEDSRGTDRLRNLIIDLARDSSNMNLVLQCRLDPQGQVYLYLPQGGGKPFVPLFKRLQEFGVRLHLAVDEGFETELEAKTEADGTEDRASLVNRLVIDLLHEMAVEEMANFAS